MSPSIPKIPKKRRSRQYSPRVDPKVPKVSISQYATCIASRPSFHLTYAVEESRLARLVCNHHTIAFLITSSSSSTSSGETGPVRMAHTPHNHIITTPDELAFNNLTIDEGYISPPTSNLTLNLSQSHSLSSHSQSPHHWPSDLFSQYILPPLLVVPLQWEWHQEGSDRL